MIETGARVKLRTGKNTYVVEFANAKYVYLVCTTFFGEEDLGDGIFCTRQGQGTFIAQFHSWKYEKMIEVTLLTADRHDGTSLSLMVLPNRGDTLIYECATYRVNEVRHHVGPGAHRAMLILEAK